MKNFVVKGWMIAVIVPVVIFGGIYLTIGSGHWSTTRSLEPVRLDSGEYSPGDIRGSYAFSEVEEFFGVPTALLFQAFMIPEDLRQPSFQVKNMESMFAPTIVDGAEMEVGTDLIRVFTSLYTGIPYDSSETTHLPESAFKILVQEQKLDDEQKAYWKAHTFLLILAAEAGEEGEIVTVPDEHVESEGTVDIKGRTTLGELLGYGLTKEQFKTITGVEMPDNMAMGLRDFVSENGLDMETVKTGLLEVLAPSETAPAEAPAAEAPAATEEPQTPASTEETPAEVEPSTSEQTDSEITIEIKGSTTIAGLQGFGLTPEQFAEITGVEMPEDGALKLKDFADQHGLDMETIRTALIEALQ